MLVFNNNTAETSTGNDQIVWNVVGCDGHFQ